MAQAAGRLVGAEFFRGHMRGFRFIVAIIAPGQEPRPRPHPPRGV